MFNCDNSTLVSTLPDSSPECSKYKFFWTYRSANIIENLNIWQIQILMIFVKYMRANMNMNIIHEEYARIHLNIRYTLGITHGWTLPSGGCSLCCTDDRKSGWPSLMGRVLGGYTIMLEVSWQLQIMVGLWKVVDLAMKGSVISRVCYGFHLLNCSPVENRPSTD